MKQTAMSISYPKTRPTLTKGAKNMFVIYDCLGSINGTSLENYNAIIQDKRRIYKFDDFKSKEEVKQYVIKYLHFRDDDIIIK